MKNDLQLLIDELQRQCDYLKEEMNDCIEEWDYLGADKYKRAYIYTNSELNILKNLENPNHDQISFLKRIIERLEKLKSAGYESEGIKNMDESFKERLRESILRSNEKQLNKYKKELSVVEKEEYVFHYDSDNLRVCFEKMLEEEIDQFILEAKDDGIIFHFSLIGTNLNIEVKTLKVKGHKYWLKKIVYSLKQLQNLGFDTSDDHATKVIYDFDNVKVRSTIELLSRIYYEVFHLYGERTAEIKF